MKLIYTLYYICCLFCHVLSFIDQPCGPGGILNCNTPNSVATITGANTVVQNCVFVNCGSVIISGGSLTLSGVTIKACGTQTCAPIRLSDGANADMTNVSFLDNRAQADSGAIMTVTDGNNDPTTLTITNAVFRNCSAPDSAGIWIDQAVSLNCTNCLFDGMETDGDGTVLQAGSTSQIYFKGGACQNSIGGSSGCVYVYGSDSYAVFDGFNVFNATAYGTAGFIVDGATLYLKNAMVDGVSCVGGDGAFLHIQGNGILYVDGCDISDIFSGTSGGLASIWGGSLDIRNSILKRVSSNGAGFAYCWPGNFYFVNCTFDNAGMTQPLKESFWTLGGDGATLTAVNSRFLNSYAPYGGNILIWSKVNVTLEGCTFSNNRAVSVGGVICAYSAPTIQVRNCIFTNNTAKTDGGVFFASSSATINLLEGNVFTGNRANRYGGVVYLEQDSKANFLRAQTASGNMAGSLGTFLFSEVTDLTNIIVSAVSPNVQGSLFIADSTSALSIRSALNFGFPNAQLQGYPAQLLVSYIDATSGLEQNVTSTASSSFQILIQETLPDLRVRAADVFGNILDANLVKPIIPQIKPLTVANGGVNTFTLQGQTIGAIVDSKSKSAILKRVTVVNAQPQVTYYLTLQDLSFSLSPVSAQVFNDSALRSFVSFPNLTVSYSSCKAGTEIFFISKCYSLVQVSSPLKAALSVIAVFGLVLAALLSAALLKFRDSTLIILNGISFLSLHLVGSVFSFLNVFGKYIKV